jgi:hypothetical protein
LTQRFNELQSEIRETAPAGFAREIFPELEELYEPAPSPVDQWQEQSTKLSLLMKMMQLMEDVWFGCYLDTHFNHPLNLGWLNLFHRWAWTPTFRFWWPFLSPMYGSGFRRFALEQFDLGESTHRPSGRLQCAGASIPAGLAQRWWSTRMRSPLSTGEKLVFTYNLDLTPSQQEPMAIQVGVAFVEIREGVATWNSEELFVPPSLWGGGFGGSFLRELTNHLTGPGARCHPAVSRCRVELMSRERLGPDTRGTVPSARRRTDRGSRQQFVDLIEFYKSAGFDVVKAPTTSLTLEWTPGAPPGMGPGKPPGRHRFDSWEG